MNRFKVKDLMVNVITKRRGGGASLCAEDTSGTVPTPLTPVVLVAANRAILEQVAVATKKMGDNPAVIDYIDRVALEIGREVVVGALQGGGVYYPDPNCGGTSLETIPTPITPYVHKNAAVLQASHLGQLREQLQVALEATVAAEKALIPTTRSQVRAVKSKLEGALRELG